MLTVVSEAGGTKKLHQYCGEKWLSEKESKKKNNYAGEKKQKIQKKSKKAGKTGLKKRYERLIVSNDKSLE
jgi:hypothetical protein